MNRKYRNGARGFLLAAACSFALAGCVTEDGGVASGFGPKHLQQLSPAMVAQIEQKGMAKNSPVLLRIYKEESELEVWKQARDGKYALLKTYPICRWSGELGPKVRQGDRQAPEGFYTITPEQMNPRSSYHLSFDLGFPNEYDRSHGRTGAHLMVHGDCSSSGCYAMTDEQVSQIFALAREAFDGGQLSFQVQAYPFRMTGKNMARHRNNPHLAYWKMLKEGSDHFEVTKTALKVDVCDRRYVFNALNPSQPFSATAQCPAYNVRPDVAKLVTAKKQTDDREFAMLANMNIPAAPVVTGNDGGTNSAFAYGNTRRAPAQQSAPAVAATPEAETTSSTPRRAASAPSSQKKSASSQSPSQSRNRSAGIGGNDPDDQPAAPPQRSAPAQRQNAPQALPGAAPILSSGGFSYTN